MLICLKGVATQINNWKILYTDLPLLFSPFAMLGPVAVATSTFITFYSGLGEFKNSNSVTRTLLFNCGFPNPKPPSTWQNYPGFGRVLNPGDKPNWVWDQKYPTDPLTVCRLFGTCPPSL